MSRNMACEKHDWRRVDSSVYIRKYDDYNRTPTKTCDRFSYVYDDLHGVHDSPEIVWFICEKTDENYTRISINKCVLREKRVEQNYHIIFKNMKKTHKISWLTFVRVLTGFY